jgi:hypothetical protein
VIQQAKHALGHHIQIDLRRAALDGIALGAQPGAGFAQLVLGKAFAVPNPWVVKFQTNAGGLDINLDITCLRKLRLYLNLNLLITLDR